jgi:hypothetical protein
MDNDPAVRELIDYLHTVAANRRKRVEDELHRIELHAVRHLKRHGLKVTNRARRVPVSFGSRIGFPRKRDNEWSIRTSVESCIQQSIEGKTRPCKVTYDDQALRRIAADVLRNKRASEEDHVAASFALQLPDLWIAYNLSNPESLGLTASLIDISSELPVPAARKRLFLKGMAYAKLGQIDSARDMGKQNAYPKNDVDRWTNDLISTLEKKFALWRERPRTREKPSATDEAKRYANSLRVTVARAPSWRFLRDEVKKVRPDLIRNTTKRT